MKITAQQLADAAHVRLIIANQWVGPINAAAARFEISISLPRLADFIAQTAHESMRYRALREIWGPTEAQRKYEGRADLGNVRPGDGFRYRGRGLIQITGRVNYRECGKELGIDFESHPELLEQPEYAALSAAWWWRAHGCNEIADSGDFKRLTRRINGGLNGLEDRLALRASAWVALGIAPG